MPQPDEDLESFYSKMRLRHQILVKLLMKIPIPGMPFIISRKLPLLEGIFHGMILPVFVFLIGIFTYWLIPTATIMFGFPSNIVIILIVLTLPFALFARIELERSINWWKGAFGSSTQWDTSKTAQELVELFKKQQEKTKR